MALLIAAKPVELREILLRQKPEAMLRLSPKATVPVLHLPDKRVIDESLEIIKWTLADSHAPRWPDPTDAELIAENDGSFKQHLDRYKYPNRFDSDPLEHRGQAIAFLEKLEARLSAARGLTGPDFSFTDFAIFPFVRQFCATDPEWFAAQELPRLQTWLSAQLSSDIFEKAMIRLPPWQPGDEPIIFGKAAI